ncbi:hypothetical protein BGW39_005440 [Mortierella sp. 14UC]|nr:hypothetical protein BGW39_005440 [Mortierella sp. 14UC]
MSKTDNNIEGRFQAVRPIYNNVSHSNGLLTTTSTASKSDSDILHVDIHEDPTSGKKIVLWSDILVVFKSAAHVRHDIRVLPFLKDRSLKDIQPLRIEAVPNATLDVYIEDNITHEEKDAARTLSGAPQTLPPLRRGPEYDPHEQARWGDFTDSSLPSADESINIDGKGEIDGSSPANNPHTTPAPHDAIMQLTAKAKQGDMSAQVELGEEYFSGYEDGLPQDSEAAMKWFLQAANQGHPAAQYYVGLMYYRGLGVPVDKQTAAEWFLKAANQKEVHSQVLLGEMYLHGQGIPEDPSRALQWLLPPANEGHAEAQYYIGCMYNDGTPLFSQDYSKAMEWYLKAAGQGHAGSQVKIGELYFNGHGVFLKNKATALMWFLKAAEQGDPRGQRLAGECYENVQHLQDYPKAIEWYLKAAQQGCQESQFAVGRMYEEGYRGVVEQDYSAALRWYLKAAKQGHIDAQVSLAKMYYQGKGRKRPDYFKAVEWYQKAADQRSHAALRGLAIMYRTGRGVDKDFGEAKRLYNIIGVGAVEDLADTLREEEEEEEEEEREAEAIYRSL